MIKNIKRVVCRERLPIIGGYFTVEFDNRTYWAHWSVENQIWTIDDGSKQGRKVEADHFNYWYEDIQPSKIYKNAKK